MIHNAQNVQEKYRFRAVFIQKKNLHIENIDLMSRK